MSARNILQAKDVTKDPMKNLNASKVFLDKYTDALVLSTTMEFFRMANHTDQPTKHNISQLEQTQEKVMEVLDDFINEFATPPEMPPLRESIQSHTDPAGTCEETSHQSQSR